MFKQKNTPQKRNFIRGKTVQFSLDNASSICYSILTNTNECSYFIDQGGQIRARETNISVYPYCHQAPDRFAARASPNKKFPVVRARDYLWRRMKYGKDGNEQASPSSRISNSLS